MPTKIRVKRSKKTKKATAGTKKRAKPMPPPGARPKSVKLNRSNYNKINIKIGGAAPGGGGGAGATVVTGGGDGGMSALLAAMQAQSAYGPRGAASNVTFTRDSISEPPPVYDTGILRMTPTPAATQTDPLSQWDSYAQATTSTRDAASTAIPYTLDQTHQIAPTMVSTSTSTEPSMNTSQESSQDMVVSDVQPPPEVSIADEVARAMRSPLSDMVYANSRLAQGYLDATRMNAESAADIRRVAQEMRTRATAATPGQSAPQTPQAPGAGNEMVARERGRAREATMSAGSDGGFEETKNGENEPTETPVRNDAPDPSSAIVVQRSAPPEGAWAPPAPPSMVPEGPPAPVTPETVRFDAPATAVPRIESLSAVRAKLKGAIAFYKLRRHGRGLGVEEQEAKSLLSRVQGFVKTAGDPTSPAPADIAERAAELFSYAREKQHGELRTNRHVVDSLEEKRADARRRALESARRASERRARRIAEKRGTADLTDL